MKNNYSKLLILNILSITLYINIVIIIACFVIFGSYISIILNNWNTDFLIIKSISIYVLLMLIFCAMLWVNNRLLSWNINKIIKMGNVIINALLVQGGIFNTLNFEQRSKISEEPSISKYENCIRIKLYIDQNEFMLFGRWKQTKQDDIQNLAIYKKGNTQTYIFLKSNFLDLTWSRSFSKIKLINGSTIFVSNVIKTISEIACLIEQMKDQYQH